MTLVEVMIVTTLSTILLGLAAALLVQLHRLDHRVREDSVKIDQTGQLVEAIRSDVRQAMELCIEAAKGVERVLETPTPVCLLKGFGDSSIDLELRFWIRDPRNGTANVRSEVMLGIWDRFREHAIELPFPQRDLHIPDLEKLVEQVATRFSQGPPHDQAHEPKQS